MASDQQLLGRAWCVDRDEAGGRCTWSSAGSWSQVNQDAERALKAGHHGVSVEAVPMTREEA